MNMENIFLESAKSEDRQISKYVGGWYVKRQEDQVSIRGVLKIYVPVHGDSCGYECANKFIEYARLATEPR